MFDEALAKIIKKNANNITTKLIEAIKTHPRTKYYHNLEPDLLKERVLDICKNFDDWIIDRTEEQMKRIYLNFGRIRYREGVPLEQLIYAIFLTRKYITSILHNMASEENPLKIYQLLEFIEMISTFFEEMVYFISLGYKKEKIFQETGEEDEEEL